MMLDPKAHPVDIAATVVHFRAHGWARLGKVASDQWLECLRSRADDIMLGRVIHEGLFFQNDAESGRYEDLDLRTWLGRSGAAIPKNRETGARPPLSRMDRKPPLRRHRPGDRRRRGRALSRDSLRKERAGRDRAALAPGRRELLGARPGSGASNLDGTGRRSPRIGLHRSARRESRRRAGDVARRHHSTRHRRASGCRPAQARAPRPRGRGASHPRPPLAPIGDQYDGPPAPSLYGVVHACVDAVHAPKASAEDLCPRLRA